MKKLLLIFSLIFISLIIFLKLNFSVEKVNPLLEGYFEISSNPNTNIKTMVKMLDSDNIHYDKGTPSKAINMLYEYDTLCNHTFKKDNEQLSLLYSTTSNSIDLITYIKKSNTNDYNICLRHSPNIDFAALESSTSNFDTYKNIFVRLGKNNLPYGKAYLILAEYIGKGEILSLEDIENIAGHKASYIRYYSKDYEEVEKETNLKMCFFEDKNYTLSIISTNNIFHTIVLRESKSLVPKIYTQNKRLMGKNEDTDFHFLIELENDKNALQKQKHIYKIFLEMD
ncbi:hypothetical protein [Tepidibacter mesophilus]|uniref:hypothetical protein n=1 Tax=Tepidibacter mesophilus TaxID=655607 RepID=UPI000C089DD3|nr:hypothetical protein [Tepidibacter mesophilus]